MGRGVGFVMCCDVSEVGRDVHEHELPCDIPTSAIYFWSSDIKKELCGDVREGGIASCVPTDRSSTHRSYTHHIFAMCRALQQSTSSRPRGGVEFRSAMLVLQGAQADIN